MAHYLDRYFRESKWHLLLHDLRLVHEGEVAQIDHLVAHRYGVAIVESKSVSTAVRINRAGEWERRSNRVWRGMPDPLLQGERQGLVLKRLLTANTEALLGRVAFGLKQSTFRNMAIDAFAAISDQGTISRALVGQAPRAMKADAIPPAVEELIADYRKAASLLNPNFRSFAEAPRDFNEQELLRIAHFLRTRHTPSSVSRTEEVTEEREETGGAAGTEQNIRLVCRYCNSAALAPELGRYGPYGKCASCGKNTSARVNCSSCSNKVWLERSPQGFSGSCEGCNRSVHVLVGADTGLLPS